MNSSARQKSGILGGTFDPVHLGHLGLARDVLETMHLDRVWFIPAWRSPHKPDRVLAGADHRLNMLKEALAPFPKFQISEIELRQKEISYTINTLTALHQRHPGQDWYLILGMDTFRNFASWKQVREILHKVHLVIVTRPGYPDGSTPTALPSLMKNLPVTYQLDRAADGTQTFLSRETEKTMVFCGIEPLDISSSNIRSRIKARLSVKKMLPPEVERYIMTHLLYQANPQPQPE
jgi:nicotinate-nucleotide adenylyltransferase